jgi:BMFP domain-containing protein YqiC
MSVDTVQPPAQGEGIAAGPRLIEDLVRKLVGGLPPLVGAARQDLELHFRRVLQEQLVRLNLCSRTEFDAQARALAHTRQRLSELEARVVVLEQHEAPASPMSAD